MPKFGSDRALLDATSSPLHPAARETLMAAIDAGWADPRRLHREGRLARRLLDEARAVVADGLGLRSEEVSFHPSGPHALHAAMRGVRHGRRRVGSRLVTSAIDQAGALHALTSPDRPVPVDDLGRVDMVTWAEAVSEPGVALAVTALGNAEVGTLQPVAELASCSARRGVPLLLDVTSSWGRIALPAQANGYVGDAASFAGPPVGVVGIRTGTRFRLDAPPSAPEGGRELAGPWIPLALAVAEAWRQGEPDMVVDATACHALIDRLRRTASAIPDVWVAGDAAGRLPHIVTFSALYVDGEALVQELDRRGFAVASGSACTADTLEPSHVLAAMGGLTHGNIRITLPRASVAPRLAQWVDALCHDLPEAIARVRAELGTSDL